LPRAEDWKDWKIILLTHIKKKKIEIIKVPHQL
jgi:hypothetical protein